MQFEQCTLDEVAEALEFLDAGVSRADWILLGMAIKSEFGEGGRSTFEDFSQKSDKYSKADFKAAWKSIKQGGRTNIATLFKLAIDKNYKPVKTQFTEDEKQKRQHESQARRVLREQETAEEQRLLTELQNHISVVSEIIWNNLPLDGESEYLNKKQVNSCGARVVKKPFMIVVDLVKNIAKILVDYQDMIEMATFKKQNPDAVSFHWLKLGTLVLPMFDINQKLWSLQFVLPNGTKLFIKNSRKSGTCFLLGSAYDLDANTPICLAEGFATGASIHMATGYPVFVCWDDGNLVKIAQDVRHTFPNQLMLICGDNDLYDKKTGEKNGKNAGVIAAQRAADKANCSYALPSFAQMVSEDKEVANV